MKYIESFREGERVSVFICVNSARVRLPKQENLMRT